MTLGLGLAMYGLAILLLGLATKTVLNEPLKAPSLAAVAAGWLLAAAIALAMARADRMFSGGP